MKGTSFSKKREVVLISNESTVGVASCIAAACNRTWLTGRMVKKGVYLVNSEVTKAE